MIMDSGMELHEAIYQYLKNQIQFGIYQFGDHLPTLEDSCRQFHVSLDTMNPAYHRLRQEGYISLSKKAGAKVSVSYGPDEVEQNIQTYFAKQKKTLMDLADSLWPLLGQAQCFALKQISLETRNPAEMFQQEHLQLPSVVWNFLDQKYDILGNKILMQLIRYLNLYFHGAFWGVIDNIHLKEKTLLQLQVIAGLCREQSWHLLPSALKTVQDELSSTLYRFYEERISVPSETEEEFFYWDAYNKPSQLRYSLAMDLLKAISQGVYPVGSYLPPAGQLSAEKGVSVSTVRRAVCLLNSIGAVKSSRPLGARVLPPAQSIENCDFNQPDLRRRLLDLTESLHIFALSSKAVCERTLASLDACSLQKWKLHLSQYKTRERYELVTYASLELISKHAPSQIIRTIYSQLLRLLFWGNSLRGMRPNPKAVKLFFMPHFEQMIHSLETMDYPSFSSTLECLLLYELHITVTGLQQLGIREVDRIVLPQNRKNFCEKQDKP